MLDRTIGGGLTVANRRRPATAGTLHKPKDEMMIASTIVTYRNRREPFDWDFEGRTGTYYAFEAIDEDDVKAQIGCSAAQWEMLAKVERGTMLAITFEAKKVKVYEDGLALADGA